MTIRLTILLVSLSCGGSVRADVAVSSVSPPANSLSAPRSAPISATFSMPIDPTTVSMASFSVFGLWSGAASGEISMSEDGRSLIFAPARPFSAGERVTVSLARSMKATDGSTLEHGYSWHFMVEASPATLSPVETTRISVRMKGEAQIQTYGAYAGDFNEDGFSDLAVPNERSNDVRLFLNDGTGFYRRFDTYVIPSGSRPSVNEGADFDRDGHIDYVVGNSTGATVGLFMGDGNGLLEFEDTFAVGLGVRGLAVLDLNGDNYPDVATASRQQSVVSTLINDGTGSFLPATTFPTPAIGETSAAAADMNEDGMMDLVVGSYVSGQMVVLMADGDGGLDVHGTYRAGGSVWMIASGDVNGDGHADMVSANSDNATVSVLLGDGMGSLGSPVVYPSGAFTIAIDLGDLDGDGDLDMVSSNFGSTTGGDIGGSWAVFENDGTGAFTRHVVYQATAAGSCVILHDRNNDGTLDITAIDELQDELILFTNESVPTSMQDPDGPSASASLHLYPNPMGDIAHITYRIGMPSRVRLEVFDVLGRLVATLLDGEQAAGHHQEVFDSGSGALRPGAYYVVLSTEEGRLMSRLLKFR